MRLLFRPSPAKIFLRRLFRSLKMDSDNEEDTLYYSHQKLSSLIRKKGDKAAALTDYLDSLNYQPIKDFSSGLEWFNVSEPLSFEKHLKGKIVVLDFFTYCCINCMHIIPDLREVEKEFSVQDGLVVIGVHSAKFENEKQSSNILAAVQRYNITHPVVNDYNSQMWKNCEVHCWPTLLILGPNANPIVMLMGEGHKENLRVYIRASLDYYKSKNQISNHRLPFESAYRLLPDLKGPLLFPGKITGSFNENGQEVLAISDSGNNRILVLKPNGTILHQVGNGKIGFKDGTLSTAEFNSPQGLVFQNSTTLVVADTENHAIRKIDLKEGKVETLVGTGVQGNDMVGGKQWKQQIISSPWDVCIFKTPDMDMTFYPDGNPPIKDVLIIAMAGTHQIWALFLEDTVWWKCKKFQAGTCLCIAGSGREENRNNAYPQSAGFAQPSGLALSHTKREVYIADSESSSIRRLSLVDGKVTAVAGGDRNPNNLFAFGDKDGSLSEAKLQHLLGLAISKDEDVLLVADTYNHKLKKVNLSQNMVATIHTSASDTTDGRGASFNEPAGLCVGANGNKIYLADTNNHSIKVISLGHNYSVKSISKLTLTSASESVLVQTKHQVHNSQPVIINNRGGKIIFDVDVVLTDGLKLTEDAPQSWSVKVPEVIWSSVPSSGDNLENIDVVINVPTAKEGTVEFLFDLVTCTTDVCLPKIFVVRVPINFQQNGATNTTRKVQIYVGTNSVEIK